MLRIDANYHLGLHVYMADNVKGVAEQRQSAKPKAGSAARRQL